MGWALELLQIPSLAFPKIEGLDKMMMMRMCHHRHNCEGRAYRNSIDFDDTYDGLGDQLDEDEDDFNDDTFGGEETAKPVGKDFDFYGSTSKVTTAINEEAMRFNRQQAPSKTTAGPPSKSGQTPKPFRTGYEAYKNPAYVPDLHVDASLWGSGSSKPAENSEGPHLQSGGYGIGGAQHLAPSGRPAKKMMSLEEVEAAMRVQPKKPSAAPQQQTQALPQFQPQAPEATRLQQQQHQHQISPQQQPLGYTGTPQRPPQQRATQHPKNHASDLSQTLQQQMAYLGNPATQVPQSVPHTQALHREQNPTFQPVDAQISSQPRQILQNPNRTSQQSSTQPSEFPGSSGAQPRRHPPFQNGTNVPLPIIYHPSQIMNLSEEERNAYLDEEARRAKRNHKIFLLSKGNGLMTPQDKNFITRIQLQQLMTATGNAAEHDPDAFLSEDFYYQVYNQIENRPRQNPQQPLSNFAQTYLLRTGGRQGGMGRRQRGGDSHVQRMEQQVQRAVEAAKAKPKNKQLVIEGSLGKISFSNAKTPKPLLNIRRHDSSDVTQRQNIKRAPQAPLSTTDRKAILKNLEAVYSTLMRIEDHDRRLPAPPTEDSDPATVQNVVNWQQTFQDLSQQLWMELKVTEPIMPESAIVHPFIAFLSYPKGKKAIPRIFNHIDENQRLTILTMIMVNLDNLDVIRLAQPHMTALQPSSLLREQIDIFLQAVMPSLFSYVTEAQLNIVIGLLGLVIERANLNAVAHTRVGLEILTMLLSRAAIVRATEVPDDQAWEQWLNTYNHFFDLVEPVLGDIFPASVNAGQDEYVWQFLAASGSGASPEQQQRLVLAVK